VHHIYNWTHKTLGVWGSPAQRIKKIFCRFLWYPKTHRVFECIIIKIVKINKRHKQLLQNYTQDAITIAEQFLSNMAQKGR